MHQVWSWIKHQRIGLLAIGLGLVALSLSGVTYEYKGDCNIERVNIGLMFSIIAVIFSLISLSITKYSMLILSLVSNIAVFYYILTQFLRGSKADDAACDFIDAMFVLPSAEIIGKFLL